MKDWELLEKAAKAAGIENLATKGDIIICNDEDGYSAVWNPLTDDGDAFRLAVKINLKSATNAVWVISMTSIAEYEDDPLAATRRAIVRAAAATLAGDVVAVPLQSDLPEDNYCKDQAEAFYGVEKK